MTIVNVDLRRPAVNGTDAPAKGYLECVPTRRRHIEAGDDFIVLPQPFTAELVDGKTQLDLAHTDGTFAWSIAERLSGGARRYVLVPISGPVDYGDLVDVDPESFDPIPPPDPAWLPIIEELATEIPKTVGTFADLMNPYGKIPFGTDQARVTKLGGVPPSWWATNQVRRWDEGGFQFGSSPIYPYGYFVDGVGFPTLGGSFYTHNSAQKPVDGEVVIVGKKFAFRYLVFGTQGDVQIWMDRAPMSISSVPANDVGGQGAYNWIQFEFDQVESHHFRIAGAVALTGIDYDPTDPVYVQKPARGPAMAVVSDSYWEQNAQGTRASVYSPDILFHTLTGVRVVNLSQGGTGFVNNGAGAGPDNLPLPGPQPFPATGWRASHIGSADNLASLDAAEFEIGFANGSGNDGPPFSEALVTGAIRDFFEAMAELKPDVPWYWSGIEPISQFRNSFSAARQIVLKALADETPNVVKFIDAYGEQWLTGTGDNLAPNGSGNQDYLIRGDDHIHPSTAGFQWWIPLTIAAMKTSPISLKGIEL